MLFRGDSFFRYTVNEYFSTKKGWCYGRKEGFHWISLLVGIVLIVGSVFAFMNPVATFLTLAIMLGIVAVVRGLMLIVAFFRISERTTFKSGSS